MSVAAPFQTLSLVGHQEATSQIERAWQSGRMPHAWLISGMEGIGKATFAYHVAHYVFSNGQNAMGKVDPNAQQTKLVLASAHPDLFILERPVDEKGALKNIIPVEKAREIPSFFHKTSSFGGWRVAIIDSAQTLNRFGQNAILKIIEEPPARSLVLITTTTTGALLPTIKSRCRELSLAPLSRDDLRAALTTRQADLSSVSFADLADYSEGSVGCALALLETETLTLLNDTLSVLKEGGTLDMPKLHALADRIAKKTSSDEAFLLFKRLLIAHLNKNIKKAALSGVDKNTLQTSLSTVEEVSRLLDMASFSNLDKKTTFLNAMTKLKN